MWETFVMRGGTRQSAGKLNTEGEALSEALKHQSFGCRAEIEGPGGCFYSDEEIRACTPGRRNELERDSLGVA
jgi:hypothetical protein